MSGQATSAGISSGRRRLDRGGHAERGGLAEGRGHDLDPDGQIVGPFPIRFDPEVALYDSQRKML